MGEPNPALARQRWTVAVEFFDGDRIVGTSPADVLERWGRRAVFALDADQHPVVLTTPELKRLVSLRLRRLMSTRLDPTLDDEVWLRSGAREGHWHYIDQRKDSTT